MEGLDFSKLLVDLVMNLISIVILFFIVRTLAYKPVKKFLSDRAERVAGKEKAADDAVAEANAKKAEYEQLMSQSEKQAQDIIDEGEKEASEKASAIIKEANLNSAGIIENANAQAKNIIDDAKAKAENEKKESLNNMKDDVVDLAIGISEKILGRELTDKDNKHIAEDFFEN